MKSKAIKRLVANEIPPPDCCSCDLCGWRGKVTDCYEYQESESWENPQIYIVHDCPNCKDGGRIDNYWYSDERNKL